MMVLYNGELLPADAVRLPLPNRGLYFNDGFFETLVWEPAGLRYLPYHVARMQRAAVVLGLELPPALATGAALTATVRQLAANAPEARQRIRLQLWRGGGGLYTPPTPATDWLITQQPFQPHDTPVVSCEFAETVCTHHSPVSFCKGPNALTYVLAAQERQRRGLDEVLLLSPAGHVAEGVAATVFWSWREQLFTPALTTGCVAGVRRAHLLQVARRHGLVTHEVQVCPEEIANADIVFTANVAGLRAIQQLNGRHYETTHPLLTQLRQWEQRPG